MVEHNILGDLPLVTMATLGVGCGLTVVLVEVDILGSDVGSNAVSCDVVGDVVGNVVGDDVFEVGSAEGSVVTTGAGREVMFGVTSGVVIGDVISGVGSDVVLYDVTSGVSSDVTTDGFVVTSGKRSVVKTSGPAGNFGSGVVVTAFVAFEAEPLVPP